MLQPHEISTDTLSHLNCMYIQASRRCKAFPDRLSPKKQAKLRKALCRKHRDTIGRLPEDIAAWFAPSVSDEALFAFLKACGQQLTQRWNEQAQKLEAMIAPLDAETQAALRQLADLDFWPHVTLRENCAELLLEDGLFLSLSDADGLPADCEGYPIDRIQLSFLADQNRFCLQGQFAPGENVSGIALTFSGAAIRYEPYDCTEGIWAWENPWYGLSAIAACLCTRAQLPWARCNPAEAALLPLCREIAALRCWAQYDVSLIRFPLLKAMVKEYRRGKALHLLEQMEHAPANRKRTAAVSLIRELCRREYAPVWRVIFNQFRASQAGYPSMAELLCAPQPLQETRSAIERQMAQNGYTGTYPDFVKRGSFKGLHLENTYGRSYLLWNETHAQHHIHCAEAWGEPGALTVQFLCGAALLRKGEACGDIYDCMFNANGRRYFRTIRYAAPAHTANGGSLAQGVTIAMKKAQLQPLTKEEKQMDATAALNWKLLCVFSLLGGGFAAVFWTLCMLLLTALIALIFGGPEAIVPLIRDFPWYLTGILWVVSSAAIGLLAAFARRK